MTIPEQPAVPDRIPMKVRYVGVIVAEAVVLVGLWLFQRYFGG